MRREHVERSLPELLAGSASGLHAKVFGFDGRRVSIGSTTSIPAFRQTSPIGTPFSARFRMNASRASEDSLAFIAPPLFFPAS